MTEKEVLIVDDSQSVRRLAGLSLTFKGYRVMTKDNAKAAWELLKGKRFDLLITDTFMPVMDGFELLSKIKKNGKFRRMRRIVLTVEGDELAKQKCLELGVDAYLTKPFQPVQLVEKAEELLKGSKR